MRSKRLHLFVSALTILVLFSCTRKTEDFTSEPLSDYLPLQVGKYITYRLDSTIFTNFGAGVAIHSYQEKQIVDAKITDALGRDSYRILRFIRDTAGVQPWAPAGSYAITPTDKTIEVIENNLRFIKLVKPIVQDYSWKGNRYLVSWSSDTVLLTDEAFSPTYSFDNDDKMDNWDYTYSSIGGSLTVKGQTYNDVLTVDGVDESLNANRITTSVIDKNVYASVNYLQDNYAKGVGLISQEFIMWEYQPPTSPTAGTQGFGVKRSIIDHN